MIPMTFPNKSNIIITMACEFENGATRGRFIGQLSLAVFHLAATTRRFGRSQITI